MLEENEPLVETQLAALAHRSGTHVEVIGRLTGHVPREGELTPRLVADSLRKLTGDPRFANAAEQLPDTRANPTVGEFCEGCPYVLCGTVRQEWSVWPPATLQ